MSLSSTSQSNQSEESEIDLIIPKDSESFKLESVKGNNDPCERYLRALQDGFDNTMGSAGAIRPVQDPSGSGKAPALSANPGPSMGNFASP